MTTKPTVERSAPIPSHAGTDVWHGALTCLSCKSKRTP